MQAPAVRSTKIFRAVDLHTFSLRKIIFTVRGVFVECACFNFVVQFLKKLLGLVFHFFPCQICLKISLSHVDLARLYFLARVSTWNE